MNNIIIKFLSFFVFSFVFQSVSCAGDMQNNWYFGGSLGYSDGFINDVEQIHEQQKKYGVIGGYKIEPWLTLETELMTHQATAQRYSGYGTNSELYIDFKQDYSYAFVGLRATKLIGSIFGITSRIGATYATYESNLESASKVGFSPSLGMLWKIKSFTLTNEIQQVTYPIANGRNKKYNSFNLSLVYNF